MKDTKSAAAPASNVPPGPSYWRRTRRAAWLAAALWAVVALLLPLVAQQLEVLAILGIPFGFYLGEQGVLIFTALLLLLLVRRQGRIDADHGLDG
ncbi:MAG: DUF4212 domain-containing protein [Hyphomicrobiaceae bacterium]|nr:DUF4212 domain-containing protein [Hyphomicrobiaceae bacterium]